jgi:hypothetical protein
MNELYFHEDFYCQVELLPMSALDSSTSEMGEIDAFSNAHWDGNAWTALHVRQDQSQHLLSLAISIDAVAALLDPILEPVTDIYTGFGSYKELCENTRAWTLPCETALLADFNAAGLVEHLWLVNEPPEPHSVQQLWNALKALSQSGDYFIADWNRTIAVPLANDEMLMRYLAGSRGGA